MKKDIKVIQETNLVKTVQKIFSELEERYAFFGLGVNAFNRLGPEYFMQNYHLISLRNPLENELIEKDIDIFSLEPKNSNRHLDAPRNSNTLINDSRTKKFLEGFSNKKLVFLVYKPFLAMQNLAKEKDWILCANPHTFGKKLFENKIVFRQILEKLDLPVPPGEIFNDPRVIVKNFKNLIKRYGSPLVIQHPARGGGRGTFFVKNKNDLRQILPCLEGKTLVLKYINGPSPSITGCATPWGIIYTYPQYQVLDQDICYNLSSKSGNGLWCGHDWTFSGFSKKTAENAYDAVSKVGEYMKSQGYRGIFGLDFIQDNATKNLYIGECNPRLLGSFPVLSMVQARNGEVPILALHILSFLKLTDEQNNIMRRIFPLLLESMKQKKIGSQLILHNKEACWAKNTKELRPGVYKIVDDKLFFVREGYALSHLKEREEFLLSDGMRHKMSPLSPNRRLVRFITLNNVLESYGTVSLWARRATQLAYDG
jgi:predicted ATP-grasp superfamily ATP-dependent carboligase